MVPPISFESKVPIKPPINSRNTSLLAKISFYVEIRLPRRRIPKSRLVVARCMCLTMETRLSVGQLRRSFSWMDFVSWNEIENVRKQTIVAVIQREDFGDLFDTTWIIYSLIVLNNRGLFKKPCRIVPCGAMMAFLWRNCEKCQATQ